MRLDKLLGLGLGLGFVVFVAVACGGEAPPGKTSASPGGASSSGGAANGQSIGGNRAAAGGAPTGGMQGVAKTGGMSGFGGAGQSGGAFAAGGTDMTLMGGQAATGVGGMGVTGGSSGASGFTDVAGDVPNPELDLLAGAFFRDGTVIEFRLKFAGVPLSDGGTLTVSAGVWQLEVIRHGKGLSLRVLAGALTTGLDPCTHILIDENTGWLILRIPAVFFPTTQISSVDVYTNPTQSSAGDSAENVPRSLLPPAGISPANTPACQPWNDARTSSIAFQDISLGNGFGCGVTLAGEVICWGEPAGLATLGSPPFGPFKQVSVSDYAWYRAEVYACGLHLDGTIQCWGGAPPTVAGKYRTLGDPFGCAIRDNGDLNCIDMGTGGNEIRTATGPIAQVIGAGVDECHLTEQGQISCLQSGMAPVGANFIGLAFGTDSAACGLRSDGSLDCAQASAIPYPLKAIDGGGHSGGSFASGCGLTQAGSPICWGAAGIALPVPPGPFAQLEVSSTAEGMCAFGADNKLVCWSHAFVAGNPEPATTPP